MSSALTSLIRVFPELVDLGSCVDRSRRRPATMQGWGPQRCAVAPTFSVQPGSAALGGAGLAVLVAGLLPATGLLALTAAGLTALAAIHGTAHAGRKRRGRPRGRAA